MGRYKDRRWWEKFKEKPKDHAAIPDGLGLGIKEERSADGQLFIYLKAGLILNPYIVIGKYAKPQEDETEYYVGDWTKPGVNPTTTKHVHLMMAIAKVHEIIEENDGYAAALWAARSATPKGE